MRIPPGFQERFRRINSEYIQRGASRITPEDIDRVTGKARQIKEQMKGSQSLSKYMDAMKVFVALLKAYKSGRYREIPWWAISSIAFTILYLLNPFDLIPDFIPVLGQVDDAMVIGVCLYMVDKELEKFKAWSREQEGEFTEGG